jgi:predicted nucleic acid-binding protein
MLEEPLLFERGSLDTSGVDLPPVPPVPDRLGGLGRDAVIGLPGFSEPEAVRHYTRLSRQNYAIDLGIFPLGSCTMKHNPRLNEKMARLPGFADIHPLQPQSTVQGALELIDVLADDPAWADWSLEQLDRCGSRGPLIINPLILAELSPRFERAADLEAALAQLPLQRQALPWDAAFLAGQAFKVYRQTQGLKTTPMPDFYIGAHALVGGLQLLQPLHALLPLALDRALQAIADVIEPHDGLAQQSLAASLQGTATHGIELILPLLHAGRGVLFHAAVQ